ncbi:MAG: sigma-54-dependent transcriptional regulator [Thermodesulfobacteriota bacterium]
MNKIMVVDDEKDIRDVLGGVLGDDGYSVVSASSAEEALRLLPEARPDIMLLDIWLPGKDGIAALKEIRALESDLQVIMISGHASIDTAVQATKLGAYDFIEKPLSLDKVILTVEHALAHRRLSEEVRELKKKALEKYEIIGETEVILDLKKDIEKAAPSNSWVLITGENGTGKEFVARNIHQLSTRSDKPFVEVNCAAIPDDLIESELFGHEKGAFTSAVSKKKGKFDMADEGTIFLDEIGDMSLRTQAKILRILQEQSFERVGGTELIKVDVRVIAATNKDLKEEIKSGGFREDLYYRLNVIPFVVPPLRERPDDIALLTNHFLKEFSRGSGVDVKKADAKVRRLLSEYSWPGNVRELKNLLERLVIMTPGATITIDDIPSYISGTKAGGDGGGLFNRSLLRDARASFEKEFIVRKLKANGGNIAKTAEAIGIERSHLYRKIKSFGIEDEDM